MAADLTDQLRSLVGGAHVLTGSAARPHTVDWTGRFRATGDSPVLVRPADAAETGAVLRAVAAVGGSVVVQGGNTSLVGGAVPADAEVVLSTTRMRAIGAVDAVRRRVVAGAGTSLEALQLAARPAGLDVGVDLAARGSATVGGMVATNAGGERVVRYGPMRAQVAGLEVVLADGSVVDRLDLPPKDATGYDLVGLLCGSEGTLGVVTRVALRLVPVPVTSTVALVGTAGVTESLALMRGLRDAGAVFSAVELVLPEGLDLVLAYTGLPAPLAGAHPAYLLVETEEGVEAAAERLAGLPHALDAALADDAAGRARLWRYRDTHTEAIAAAGRPVKLDVAVPLGELTAFVKELPALVRPVAGAGCTVIAFGHVAEGNLHVNVLGPGGAALDEGVTEAVTDVVLRRVAALGGSISAEHGVGRAKVRWLGLTRSPADVAAMRAVKRALDPHGLLGPGVLLPVETAP